MEVFRKMKQSLQQTVGLSVAAVVLSVVAGAAWAGPYDAPAGFYSSATGTGSTLKSQLQSIMSNGHLQRTYGAFRFSASVSDRDPNNPDNILLAYNRQSIDSTWNINGTLPWNREHVWPQSRQPGSASNGVTGNLGDPHALRPANTQVNSQRGNDPFGFAATTGSYGTIGSSFYPGDQDVGDIARSLFYSATRYNGLTLVNGTPSGNQMGDLASLIAWHYIDTPDDFEQRRNHVIFSQAENPSYYTNNRNAFVDRPEYVHSVFVDNFNDTRLTLASGTVNANGSSTLAVDLGKVIVGSALPASQTVTLSKAGLDGTYYSVNASGSATSSVNGRYNAFTVGSTGTLNLDIGVTGSTATAGLISGDVVIDNLDVTTGLGSGFGDQDANDTITATLQVVNRSNGSFAAGSDLDFLTLDFGTIDQGTAGVSLDFDFFNGLAGGSFTADLDIDSITPSLGDDDVLTTNLTAGSSITGNSSATFSAFLDTADAGIFSISYLIATSDEDIAGAINGSLMLLTLTAEVIAAGFIDGDYNGDGFVSQADLDLVLLNWGDATLPVGWAAADQFDNVQVSQNELDGVLLNWGDGTPPAVTAVPEPASIALLAGLPLLLTGRRRRVGVALQN